MKIYATLITGLQIYVIVKFVVSIVEFQLKSDNIDDYSKAIIGGTVVVTTLIMCIDFFYVIKCVRGFQNGLKEALLDS